MSSMPTTFKIFISHSSAQDKFASQVADYLGRDKVHLDIHDFEKGSDIAKEIEEHIDHSTIFVLLLSDEALDSDWVKKEIAIVRLKLLDEEIVDFVPVIIDDSITVEDHRLEDEKPLRWIKKYLLKQVLSPKMVARLVSRKMNQQLYAFNSQIRERAKLFFGRDNDIAELKLKLFEDTSSSKRAVIISGLDHVGRKRLLKEFINQTVNDVHEAYMPIKLLMTETDGIEQLIAQLNEYLELYDDKAVYDLVRDENTGLDIAVEMLNRMADCQERIIIRDEKCIVLGNGKLTNWFLTLLMRKDLHPMIHFFVASRFTPRTSVERNFPCIITRRIDGLDSMNMKALFNAYAKQRKIAPTDAEAKFFLDSLSGFPIQAYKAVDLLADNDFHTAKRHLPEVTTMFDGNFTQIVSEMEKLPHGKDILVLLSQFEFVSVDLLAQVCPDDISDALETFRHYSLYEFFGSANQYIRLNPGLADYISRNKIELPANYVSRLRHVARELLADMDNSLTDLSSQLYSIKETLRDPESRSVAKEKYLLPSFVLKVIVEEYNKGVDENVIELVELLLNNKPRKGYDEINRSIHYWYCCSLCRTRNRKFLTEVEYFRDSPYSYLFLKGFYERHLGHNRDAEEYYQKALDQSKAYGDREYVSKAEHELVMVKVDLGDYKGAYDLAKKSYERDKTNTYHIEAYFRCLANTAHPDSQLMNELIDRMELSYVKDKEDIVPSMRAQYKYYVAHDFREAINMLEEVIRYEGVNKRNYARRALREICEHNDSIQTYYGILKRLGK